MSRPNPQGFDGQVRTRTIGPHLEEGLWRRWRLASIEHDVSQAALINAALRMLLDRLDADDPEAWETVDMYAPLFRRR